MKEYGLTLEAHKTEVVILTTKRGYEIPNFMVNGVTISPKEQLKYLGLKLRRCYHTSYTRGSRYDPRSFRRAKQGEYGHEATARERTFDIRQVNQRHEAVD